MPDDPKKNTRTALTVRLPQSSLDRFKREVDRRGISQSGLVELLIADAFKSRESKIDERVLGAAGTACIAALDLVKMQNSDAAAKAKAIAEPLDLLAMKNREAAARAKAIAKLEDFLEVLAGRSNL